MCRSGNVPFNSRVKCKDDTGLNPVKKLIPIEQKQKKGDPNSILVRHKRYLRELEKKMRDDKQKEEVTEKEKKDKFEKLKQQAEKQRQKIKLLKVSEEEPAPRLEQLEI